MKYFMDWKWQLRNTINDSEQLAQYIELSSKEKADIDKVIDTYKMGISPFIAGLLEHKAIFKQLVPSIDELIVNEQFILDPLIELKKSPLPRLVHKFYDRVAILVSDMCFGYCRHCTRKNTLLQQTGTISASELKQIIDYLYKTPSVTDILLTGGDPFTLEDDILEKILSQIRSIPHISTVRIGTRSIITAPMRITDELVNMLSKYHPLWINTQFNHPDEISDLSIIACDKILSRGIPINNQSVLLKGINNNFDTMKKLLLELIKLRIRPYYLFQCDYTKGTLHFMTSYIEGMDIIRDLWGNVPGYAIPRFVVDCSSGKINIEHNNILESNQDNLILKGYNGERVIYNKLKQNKV